MSSVRVTAAGAVLVAILVAFTSPARACDDRFIKKCEKQSEAAAAAEEAVAPTAKRGAGKRVKLIASRHSKHSRFVKRVRAPRFAARPVRSSVVANPGERVSALLPRSVLARRFRGFIDPQAIAENAFEAWRKPHAIALDFDATAIAPAVETADPGEAVAANPAPVATVAVTTTPKQDKLAKPAAAPPAKSAAQMELASAESRPVVLADAGAAIPAMAIAAAAAPVLAAPVIMKESPAPADGQHNPFSFPGLVLALCGALGAASALRFIVGA